MAIIGVADFHFRLAHIINFNPENHETVKLR